MVVTSPSATGKRGNIDEPEIKIQNLVSTQIALAAKGIWCHLITIYVCDRSPQSENHDDLLLLK